MGVSKTNKNDEILLRIQEEYSDIYFGVDNLPKPYCENLLTVRVIVLGCDPSNKKRTKFNTVFGLDCNLKYFIGINQNMKYINISKFDIYAENVCKNYFQEETSKNKYWNNIAEMWIPGLKAQLDSLFCENIPVLATARQVLDVLTSTNYYKDIDSKEYYKKNIFVPKEHNKLNRMIIPFFRHRSYSLDKWEEYAVRIKSTI